MTVPPSSAGELLDRPLAPDVVRVLRFSLAITEEERLARRAILSPDELVRADRFIRAVDRVKFTAARSTLRMILGRMLARPPESLVFEYSNRGKPALAADSADGLTFNLSHTDGCALVALSRGREVGVDVERIRPTFEIDATARWVFSAGEQELFFAAPECDRRALFFAHWTRKEAFLKGVGLGIGNGLTGTTIEPLVAWSPGRECRVATPPHPDHAGWFVRDSLAPDGYAAAVAAVGCDWTLEHGEWS